jgi:hypothetical protein
MTPGQLPCRCFAIARGNDKFVSPDVVLGLAAERNAEHIEYCGIELPALWEIGDDELYMVDQPTPMQFLRFHDRLPLRGNECSTAGFPINFFQARRGAHDARASLR